MSHIPITSDRIANETYIGRWHYFLAACLSAAGLIYGSLLPFRFRDQSIDESWQLFQALWPVDWNAWGSSQDIAVNILITVPLAFFLLGTLQFRSRHPIAICLSSTVTLMLCLTLGLFVEFTQLWIDSRTSSLYDVTAQLAGAIIGSSLWLLIGPRFTVSLDHFIDNREPATRLEWLLHAYVIGLVIWSLLPFDFITNVDQLFRKYQSSHVEIIPFTFQFESAFKFWYAIIIQSALFVPVGVWAATAWRRRRESLRNVWSALAICIIANLTLEMAQLLIKSRYTSSTDVLCGTTGAALGIIGTQIWKRLRSPDQPNHNIPSLRRAGFWIVLSLAYSAILLIVFWAPFELTQDRTSIREHISRFADIPFRTMQSSGSDVKALFQTLRNFVWFMPIGMLLAQAIHRAVSTFSKRMVLSIAAVMFISVLALTIEAVQVLMPDKTADLTEVIVRSVGGLSGLLILTIILRRWSPKIRSRES